MLIKKQVEGVANSAEGGIIEKIKDETAVNDVHYIGEIDTKIYQCVTKNITTN